MRKLTKALLLALVVLLTGCSEDIFEGNSRHYDDEVVTVRMGVSMPDIPTTRAMDNPEIPTIKSLWVVVFTDDHYLKQTAKAVPCNPGPNGEFLPDSDDPIVTYFDVTLNTSDKDLIVHLVANYDLSELPFGQEGQLIGTLQTSGNQDVYWQRVEGVKVEINPGTNGVGGNVIDATSTPKVIAAPDELVEVPLVRNYAMITLENGDTNHFTLKGYAITNLPDRGSVAPRIAENTFAQYYDPAQGTRRNAICMDYVDILNQGYKGNDPYDVQHSETLTWVNAVEEDGVITVDPSYVYEYNNDRDELQTMSMIVKGRFRGDTEDTYYKLDLIYVDQDYVTHYYNVIRNFRYDVRIERVMGSGFTSPEDALSRPACNNIAGSTLVSSLTNISNGEYQLYVDKTAIVITNTGQVTFKYKYVELATGNVVNNRINIVNEGVGAGHVLSTAPSDEGNTTDWSTVTLTPNDPSNQVTELVEYVTLVDPANRLMRKVKLTFVRPYTMKVELDPNTVTQTYNYPVTVSIYIPDDLPDAIFPLHFNINSDGNTLYPQANTDMPVAVSGGNYWFQKELPLTDYNHLPVVENVEVSSGVRQTMRRLDCYFMTNVLNSTTDVHVTNTYFNDGSAHLTAKTEGTNPISNVGIEGTEYYGARHPVVAKWKLGQRSTVTVTMTETSYVDANGDSLATPVVHTLEPSYRVTQNATTGNDYYTHTFNTETFCGDVTITIQAGDQTITIHNPKKRHKLLIPEGSFSYTTGAGYGGYARGGTKAEDDWGEFEWPDFVIEGVNNGSRKIYKSGAHQGTTAHNNDGAYNDATIEIDAHYGGRDMEFYENSEMVFHTYYNYSQGPNGTLQTTQEFKTTVGAICNAYNGTIINMVLAFEAPSGGGAKPAWFGYHAPAKKRK